MTLLLVIGRWGAREEEFDGFEILVDEEALETHKFAFRRELKNFIKEIRKKVAVGQQLPQDFI